MPKGVLIDLTRCIGCRGCQVACKAWNERKAGKAVLAGDFTSPGELNSDCFSRVRFVEQQTNGAPVWSFIKDQCLHCKDPACASVCPVGALTKTKAGPVTYNYDRCMGCRYCMVACPFEMPKYEWESTFPWVRKCSFCSERIKDDMMPACVKACPTTTMYYGEHDSVVREAMLRINDKPGKYVNHIYGKEEAGGTSWIYISDIPFEQLGFKMNVSNLALPSLTWAPLAKVPFSVTGLVAVLAAIAWWRNRGNSSD